MRLLGHVFLATVAAVLFCGQVFAGGFAIHEWSARGDGMGGTLIGRADDASALAYNPAGITQLAEPQIIAGLSGIAPSHEVRTINPYTGEEKTTTSEDNIWLVPHFYAVAPITDKWYFGLGTFTRFGLGTEYDSKWPGRYQSVKSVVQSVSVNPNIAYKVNDKLSLAVGVEAMWFSLDLKSVLDSNIFLAQQGLPVQVNNPDTYAMDVGLEHKGENVAFGVNAALRYEINDTWAVGVAYRSQMEQELEGDLKLKPSPQVVATFGDALFKDGDIEGSVVLPDWLGLGVAITPSKDLRFEADLTFTRWSTYNRLKIYYKSLQSLGVPFSETQKNWRDTLRFQLGAEWDVTDVTTLRAGYVFDQCPINEGWADYMVPADDYHYFHLGAGFHWEQIGFDLAYTFLHSEDRKVDMRLEDGVLDSEIEKALAHIFSASLQYRF